mgnify:CR=1 FL=1
MKKLNIPSTPAMTNGDRIRAMDDELLATQLVQIFKEGVIALSGVKLSDNLLNEIRSCFLDKLKQPAEEEVHEQM